MTEQELDALAGNYNRMLELDENERQVQRQKQQQSQARQQALKDCVKKEAYVSKVTEEGGEEDSCTICLMPFEEGEELSAFKTCGHAFHAMCVEQWLAKDTKATCPNCRASVLAWE